MKQPIKSFEQDEVGDWVARLACGHAQHVRHRPPQDVRPWVQSDVGRAHMIGSELDCTFCEMPELPPGAKEYKSTPIFTETTVPNGLLRDHQTKAGCWGVIRILDGKLLYQVSGGRNWVLRPGVDGIIAPEAKHFVRPLGTVRFQVAFFR